MPQGRQPQAPSDMRAALARQMRRSSPPVDHTLEPAHHISFDDSLHIPQVQFSPDGGIVYCMIDAQAVDLWAAGLEHWPIVAWVLLAMVLLGYIFVALRIRRRAQVPGAPHCRRCNYNLISQAPLATAPLGQRQIPPDVRCPECGVVLTARRPRRGRGTRRRLIVPTLVMLALAGSAAWGLVWGRPAVAGIAGSHGIWSQRIDRMADKYQLEWLLQHKTQVMQIVAVETQTGEVARQVRTLRGYIFQAMCISPDGRWLVVPDGSDRLHWMSTTTGWIRSSTYGGSLPSTGGQYEAVVAFRGPAADPWVYYAGADEDASVSRLWRWRPRKGVQEVVLEEPAYVRTLNNKAMRVHSRRYSLLEHDGELRVASAPDFIQAYDENKYTVAIHAPELGTIIREFDVEGRASLSDLHPSPDGEVLYIAHPPLRIGRYSLRSGEALMPISAGMMNSIDFQLALSADGRRLFVPAHGQLILVMDLKEERWVARLNYPEPYIAPRLVVSPDGLWLAAVPFKSMGGPPTGAPYKRDLFLFDLSPLQTPPSRPPSSAP